MKHTKLFLISLCIVAMVNMKLKAQKTVQDIDGNVYHTVTIGKQTWLVENLKTTKYRNGNPIPNITGDSAWTNLLMIKNGFYCYYDNNVKNADKYGYLYNWYAVNDVRNICPVGWHIPSEKELKELIEFLGGEKEAGAKLAQKGHKYWKIPTDATNESGFTALPGGYRDKYGLYNVIDEFGCWWSKNQVDDINAIQFTLGYSPNYEKMYPSVDNQPKAMGFSVRCIKD